MALVRSAPRLVCDALAVKGIVEEPIWRPEEPREIIVPESVRAEPPTEREIPAIENPVGAAVKVWPATVKMDWGDVGVRGMVEGPIWRPEEPRETTVPEMVRAEPPTEREVPAMEKPVGAAVKVWPPTV